MEQNEYLLEEVELTDKEIMEDAATPAAGLLCGIGCFGTVCGVMC